METVSSGRGGKYRAESFEASDEDMVSVDQLQDETSADRRAASPKIQQQKQESSRMKTEESKSNSGRRLEDRETAIHRGVILEEDGSDEDSTASPGDLNRMASNMSSKLNKKTMNMSRAVSSSAANPLRVSEEFQNTVPFSKQLSFNDAAVEYTATPKQLTPDRKAQEQTAPSNFDDLNRSPSDESGGSMQEQQQEGCAVSPTPPQEDEPAALFTPTPAQRQTIAQLPQQRQTVVRTQQRQAIVAAGGRNPRQTFVAKVTPQEQQPAKREQLQQIIDEEEEEDSVAPLQQQQQQERVVYQPAAAESESDMPVASEVCIKPDSATKRSPRSLLKQRLGSASKKGGDLQSRDLNGRGADEFLYSGMQDSYTYGGGGGGNDNASYVSSIDDGLGYSPSCNNSSLPTGDPTSSKTATPQPADRKRVQSEPVPYIASPSGGCYQSQSNDFGNDNASFLGGSMVEVDNQSLYSMGGRSASYRPVQGPTVDTTVRKQRRPLSSTPQRSKPF